MMASIVERFNRTLKNDMWKFTYNGNYKWIDTLRVSNYNVRKHRIIDMHLFDVSDRLLNMLYNRVKIAALARYKMNDSVRVSKFKTVFDKWHFELEHGDV